MLTMSLRSYYEEYSLYNGSSIVDVVDEVVSGCCCCCSSSSSIGRSVICLFVCNLSVTFLPPV